MTDVEVIHVEGTIFGEEAAEQAVASGKERASSHVSVRQQAA